MRRGRGWTPGATWTLGRPCRDRRSPPRRRPRSPRSTEVGDGRDRTGLLRARCPDRENRPRPVAGLPCGRRSPSPDPQRATVAAAGDGRRACDLPACDLPACDLPACDLPACDRPACDLPACDLPACDRRGEENGGGPPGVEASAVSLFSVDFLLFSPVGVDPHGGGDHRRAGAPGRVSDHRRRGAGSVVSDQAVPRSRSGAWAWAEGPPRRDEGVPSEEHRHRHAGAEAIRPEALQSGVLRSEVDHSGPVPRSEEFLDRVDRHL